MMGTSMWLEYASVASGYNTSNRVKSEFRVYALIRLHKRESLLHFIRHHGCECVETIPHTGVFFGC